MGSRPLPPPLDPRVASLTEFVHTSSWPLMQVLLALGYYTTGFYCLVIGDTFGVSKDTRVENRVSKALCVMGLLGRGLVLFPTSDAKGVSTMLLSHIKYRITKMFSHTVCGDHNFFKKKMRIAANHL